MLQIPEFTEATLTTLTPRSQKHGDDEVPAVSLGLALVVPNTLLDAIDASIRDALFRRVDGQADLPGVEPSTPILRCLQIERVTLETKYEGWTLEVDDGIDDTSPKTFGGCKVDKLSVEPMTGGSCTLRMRVGTSDIDAERSGMLAMHVSQSIWIKLRAPQKQADQHADDSQGDGAAENESTAGELFAASAGDDEGASEDRPLTESEVFPGAHNSKAVVPITTKRRRKGLGTDADQAQRQAEVLAKDPTQVVPVAAWPFPMPDSKPTPAGL